MENTTQPRDNESKKLVRFTCDLERSLHKQLRLRAAQEERRATDLVRQAIAQYLAQ